MGLALMLWAGALLPGQQAQEPKPAESKPAAQDQQAPQAQPSAVPPPVVLESPAYVRRISVGITGGYNILDLINPTPTEQTFENPFLRVRSSAESKSQNYTFGATVNVALTDRFAVNATGLVKWSGYNLLTEFFTIVSASEVLTLTRREETRARYWELPIQVRRYNIGRREQGWRWFYGVGPSLRYVTNISTTIQDTVTGESPTLTVTKASPTSRLTYGASGGIGLQFIDDFGIRFVPEVRYTRWFGSTWDNLAAQSRRHQVEALISFTF